MFIVEELYNNVRKVNAATGLISTYAGTKTASGFSGDGGAATDAILHLPAGLAVDSIGNLYIADALNNRVRVVNAATGIITTICGTGTAGNTGDGGPASAATLNYPNDILFDKVGNLYISCFIGGVIRMVNRAGNIMTFAGNGTPGRNGDGGAATDAAIAPAFLCFDSLGNLFFCDPGSAGCVVRKINTSGIISLVAGVYGSNTYNGDNIPATSAQIDATAIAIGPDGLLYIGDAFNNRVRVVDSHGIIHTIAGSGIRATTGDGGLADTAGVNNPSPIAFDSCGNLFFGEISGERIRKITYPHCGYLSVPEVQSQAINDISVYPNPAFTEIKVASGFAMKRVEVINLIGQVVGYSDCNCKEVSLDINRLNSGVYFLRTVPVAPNLSVEVRRFVKE